MEQQAEETQGAEAATAEPEGAQEMETEMANRSQHDDDSTVDCDGLINGNGEESAADVLVPLSFPGRQTIPTARDYLRRLRDRKFLQEDKRRLSTYALGVAGLGIVLMIIHAEMCRFVHPPGSNAAFIINCCISLSTGCLLIIITAFHYKDVRLFIIDHNQMDWRIAMTSQRVLAIALELVVCAIHPIGTYWDVDLPTNSSSSAPLCVSHPPSEVLVDVEILLSVLMFLRLYLVHRTIMLHSKVLLSASYRSIGSLNSIKFSFRFVLKILLNKHPTRMLLVFILFYWITASWMLTLCERHTQESTGQLDTAMWLIAITFLTVGYGDVSPYSSCGKVVCLLTGFLGVACTAMVVAVVAKKLALDKAEEYVHFFMLDIQTTKQLRHAAANVLRECWLLHRTGLRKGNRRELRRRQRCFLEAIKAFRHLRLDQRKIKDNSSEMVDLSKLHMIITELSTSWTNWCRQLEQRLSSLEQKVDELTRACEVTSELLCQVIDPQNQEIR